MTDEQRSIIVERTWPFVSVIIPVKDGLELLVRCVQALLLQDYPSDRYEIIVVDNGSAIFPGPALPVDPRLTVLSESRPGSYAARNKGLEVARGQIIAFTDADCDPHRDWLTVSVGHLLKHPDVAMLGGGVNLKFTKGQPENGPEWFEYVLGFPQEEYVKKGYAVTANMVTRRAIFDRVGPFDARLMSGGDGEWGRRVRAAGLKQAYVPDAVVDHPARDTWVELRTKTVRTTRGVVRRAAAKPAIRRQVSRMILGQLQRSLILPVAVLREPRLSTWQARRRFLFTRWRVDVTIVVILLAALVRPGLV